MRYLIVAVIITSLLLINSAHADYFQYQENATTVFCNCTEGGWLSGHGCDLTHDGNWGTYGRADNGDNECFLFVNYSVPANAVPEFWEVKMGYGYANRTLFDECEAQRPIQLRIRTKMWAIYPFGGANTQSCWNGTSWLTVYGRQATTADAQIFEEAMWWSITKKSDIETLLTEAGAGIANFLDAIQDATVGLILGLGIIGGILLILSGIALVFTDAYYRLRFS